jgi:hypothetical protein
LAFLIAFGSLGRKATRLGKIVIPGFGDFIREKLITSAGSDVIPLVRIRRLTNYICAKSPDSRLRFARSNNIYGFSHKLNKSLNHNGLKY